MELTKKQEIVLNELAYANKTKPEQILQAVLNELVVRYEKQPTLAKMLVKKALKGA